jgi:hypothetical protein
MRSTLLNFTDIVLKFKCETLIWRILIGALRRKIRLWKNSYYTLIISELYFDLWQNKDYVEKTKCLVLCKYHHHSQNPVRLRKEAVQGP